jgi:hypothetical protein
MRVALPSLFIIVVATAGCGGNNPGQSICDNVVPAPAACMTECDPSPGAPNTCPGGYHCAPDGFCDARCTPTGNECGDGYRCTSEGRCVGENECIGLECQIVDCAAQGMPLTSISGTVYAPNGTLPLYGINVYIPNAPLPPVPDQLVCDRCGEELPGAPISKVQTDEAGRFTLNNVPAGDNIPLVISSGKWRRVITIPRVEQCTNTDLPATETRLPRNRSEGNIPRIAITTGNADALDCFPRKLGIDDSEIGKEGTEARIHLFSGNGANSFANNHPGASGNMPDAQPMWSSQANLSKYDIVFLSCEGAQRPNTKPQEALDAMKAYADAGGRVFASHWHNIWIGGAYTINNGQRPAVWDQIATWNNGVNLNSATDIIDEMSHGKGAAFATWMLNVMGSTMRGLIQVTEPRITTSSLDTNKAERWVYMERNNQEVAQIFQFTTPNEMPHNDRCGKVVFSDMHVSAGSRSRPGTPYPNDCSNAELTPQEKALAFMFFDIASCVAGPIF